jgi:hypothetical protein
MTFRLVGGLAIAIVAIMAAITFSSSNDTLADLTWGPKINSKIKYETVNVVTVPFGSTVTFTYTTTATVKELVDGKVIIDALSTEPEVDADGPTGCPIQIGGPNGTATFTLNGQYLFDEAEDVHPFATRFINMSLFIYPEKPVSEGDSWAYQVQANAATGARTAEARFKYVGIERIGKVDAYKVAIDYQETEGEEWDRISARGTKWLSVEDGTLAKEDLQIKVPHGVDSIAIDLKSVRVD